MTITKEQITGLILAGGRGRRMGGADKGLLMLDGRAMIEHVIGRLRPQVNAIVISANRNLERYRQFARDVICDVHPNHSGPLAGIASGLQNVETDYLAVVPCDAPLFSRTLVARLVDAIQHAKANVAVAHDGARLQQAFLLLKRSIRDDVEKYLAEGGRKIETWLARHKVATADFSDCRGAFTNVNDPLDHQATLVQLRQQHR